LLDGSGSTNKILRVLTNKKVFQPKKFGDRKMKTKTLTTAIFALTLIATIFAITPITNAAEYSTYPFINVAPNPVGVNQPVAVTMWLSMVPPEAPVWGGENYWPGYTVEITKPDQTTQTMGPYDSDPVGASWFLYTPDQVGTYYFQFSFAGFQSEATGHYFKPSTTEKVALTVQQDAITQLPETPLPTGFWDRPIDAQNREWWKISGNWLGTGRSIWGNAYNASGSFNPYTTAPNSAHIVWTKDHIMGGLVGGDFGSAAYYFGLSYECKWNSPVIIDGKLYYNIPLSTNNAGGGAVCVDIRTGEELWRKDDITVDIGQLYFYDSPNQHGIIPYLWDTGSTYKAYDPMTGELVYTLENASTGTIVYSPKGDMLVYMLNGRNNWLAMWNSSSIPGLLGGQTGTNAWQWRPVGKTLDWRDGIQWNVSIPDVPGVQSISNVGGGVLYARAGVTTDAFFTETPPTVVHVGYDAATGQQMWVENRDVMHAFARRTCIGDGVFAEYMQDTMQWAGFDIYTGKQLWTTEPYDNAFGMYTMGPYGIAYGKLFAAGYDGMVHCYDIKTGETLWTYSSGSSGLETPYGSWPFCDSLVIADGKVFATNGEHSPSMALWRGEKLHVINAETGEPVWNVLGWMDYPTIADGYVVTFNGYDGRLYTFGKGQTETTVNSPDIGVPLGSSVMIRGTVTDQSPGATGSPAIADEYMSQWMEYLYMDQPMPTDAKGVTVTLDAIDPNGNYISIGKATSDMNGFYSYKWTPEHEGKYTIIATFEGSESYWSSYAETAIGVDPAPSAAQPIEPEEPAAAFALGTTELAIIAVVIIAVVGVVAFWALRKRK
jgi:outer membrane protein assembly factor BamB